MRIFETRLIESFCLVNVSFGELEKNDLNGYSKMVLHSAGRTVTTSGANFIMQLLQVTEKV